MTTETSSTSSLSSSRPKHDVFLSFRSEDTGNGLTNYLYNALEEKGITTFRYDHRKTNTSLGPFQAIEESRFAIVVFSKNYASSTRCLDELAKIFECMNKPGLTVYPVFYHMNPTHVKEHFAKHEQVFRDNIGKVDKWKEALTEVASLIGWDLQNRHEADFIKEIVKYIFEKLNQTCIFGDNGLLVGMVSNVNKLEWLLDIEVNDVGTIGICGMRGIGKTTLAHEVFKRISHKFEASAFLFNIRVEFQKTCMLHLQKLLYQKLLFNNEEGVVNDYMVINNELIRNTLLSKRVLIVLDDVDSLKQIEDSVGEWKRQNHSWLSPGSRLIVTTRKKHLLRRYGDKYIHEIEKLTDVESLILLCKEAFDGNQILDEYKEVSNNIVKIANGHPLTLKELGSLLYGRSVDEWWEALAKLQENPNKYML